MMCQDRFTKWVCCKPLKTATAAAVTRILFEEVIAHFGCPNTVISDNGKQFDSRVFRSLLKELEIKHRFTPPYTPQSNPVERANRTIKTMISQYCGEKHRHWDQKLPELVMALNTARQESTGFSPAFLNFGRELEVPKSIYRQMMLDAEDGSPNSIPAHIKRLEQLQEAFQIVRGNLDKAFSKQSRHYNLRRRDWRCHVGDEVMKADHHLSSAVKGFAAKLAPKYSGPYKVTKVRSPVVYDLMDSAGKRLKNIHVKDLKPFVSSD